MNISSRTENRSKHECSLSQFYLNAKCQKQLVHLRYDIEKTFFPCLHVHTIVNGRQRGRVIRVLDFESVGPGFESHSGHFMDLFHGNPEQSVKSYGCACNRQLVCLPPAGILNHVMFHLQYLFQLFE